MNFTQTVLEVDPASTLCIGQVKGDSYKNSAFVEAALNATATDGSCLIVVEFIYNQKSSQVESHFRVFDGKSCHSKAYPVGHFNLGEPIHISFVVDNFNVFVSTNKAALPAFDYSAFDGHHYGMHFKVGAYDQGKGSDSSKGGKTQLSNLVVQHSN
eukprot:CAMPEP_0175121396 /NCGR_PEP_ID=MMETSP0087-20121206/1143_1 /TAXON_ID=136419 /ORGANISM="Unknown Unknown, Strain D1" /LENGTH=155 /DNA_ID=CAMNT_0016402929 /DNA_START=346 /DNA_END=816 /DNA_ORIENTATION=+